MAEPSAAPETGAQPAKSYTCLHRLATPLCPDTLELAPDGSTLLCASYYLDKESGEKSGALDLLQLALEDAAQAAAAGGVHAAAAAAAGNSPHNLRGSLATHLTTPDRAVFDSRWKRGGAGAPLLCATATAGARVHVDALEGGGGGSSSGGRVWRRLGDVDLAEEGKEGVSALYVDWLCGAGELEGGGGALIASSSHGSLHHLQLTPAGLAAAASWTAHNLGGAPIEVWVAAASLSAPCVVWSGGDDARLKGWDIRAPGRPTFSSAHHAMGVTSVAWHPHAEHAVATGSYDECIALWDDRRTAAPVATLGTGGGVWRMKWAPGPDASHLLAAACMYNGVHIVAVGGGGDSDCGGVAAVSAATGMTSVLHYKEHASIAYGVEWVTGWAAGVGGGEGAEADAGWGPAARAAAAAGRPLIASCSFYDNAVHLWQPDAPLWRPAAA
jgi:diphthamide biosynthesis protein 7